jgi:hypothetical protein
MTGCCTCQCPDGPGLHLENCETYLRYWELDQLDRIALRYRELAGAHPCADVALDDLIAQVLSFAKSTAELGESCVSDSASVIRHHIRADRERRTESITNRIRSVVDASGWDAVRNDPELGPIWRKMADEQREFESRI